MKTQQITIAVMLLVQGPLAGCDAVERARTRFGSTTTDTVVTATGSGLALGLEAPPTLRPGDEGMLRLSLNNQTDSAVSQVRLELHVPGWVQPAAPRPGDRVPGVDVDDRVVGWRRHRGDAEPRRLQDGWNELAGARLYFVHNPALGLWAAR